MWETDLLEDILCRSGDNQNWFDKKRRIDDPLRRTSCFNPRFAFRKSAETKRRQFLTRQVRHFRLSIYKNLNDTETRLLPGCINLYKSAQEKSKKYERKKSDDRMYCFAPHVEYPSFRSWH